MTFELGTPHGRMMATMLAGIAHFERDLISERVKFGLAAAKVRGRTSGFSRVSVRSRTVWHPGCCGRWRTGGATGGLRGTSGSARTP